MRIRVIYLLDFKKDRRVPPTLKEAALVHDDGSTAVVGATSDNRRFIYVDLTVSQRAARYLHYSFAKLLTDTLDHEYAHAFLPPGDSSIDEERFAVRFERAGRWARR